MAAADCFLSNHWGLYYLAILAEPFFSLEFFYS